MHLFIDIVDACNKHCPGCYRGVRIMPNQPGKMDIGLFKDILDKFLTVPTNKAKVIGLFNWTEPFLHDEIPLFVQACTDRKLRCTISSNFALPKIEPLIEGVLKSKLTKLVISVSGFTDEIYSRYHNKGGCLDNVKSNLEFAASFVKRIKSKCLTQVHYLDFKYNQHELDLFREYCKSIGVDFLNKQGRGYNDVNECWNTLPIASFTPKYLKISSDNYSTMAQPCAQIFDMVSVDCRGDVYLCCWMPYLEQFKIGNFLQNDFGDLLIKRFSHPACVKCGYNRREWNDHDHMRMKDALK